ncbi:sigma-70 family RNA polymerase sigma factor [Planococcus lenghuensis]|uniref:sigma-70 family RNA polymerase sigma factor n=1 Tax=Planococcus lenghuensis TaxID=2213202 RepID=UPI0018DC712A|nr:sigma-70 family RNA polymerase sigma factor [Planococcus lenghuensis]
MNNGTLQTSNALSIERELLTRGKRHELLKLMSEVGVLDRDILVMKFIHGSSNKEIAMNMGLVQCTVEDRIYKALKSWH